MNTILFIGGIGLQEILIIALVVLLFFGGKKIPELMKGMGKGVRSFKEGMNEPAEPVTPQKGRHTVVLQESGGNTLRLVKAIQDHSALGLKQAKEIVENAPCIVSDGMDETAANRLAAAMKEAGATVTVEKEA